MDLVLSADPEDDEPTESGKTPGDSDDGRPCNH